VTWTERTQQSEAWTEIPSRTISAGNDSYTKILLHFDGGFTDSNAGGSAHTWTAIGNAQTDTAIKKFGTGAGLFDGTGDWITTPAHDDFIVGALDFTLECWFNCTGPVGSFMNICGQSEGEFLAPDTSVYLYRYNTGEMAGGVGQGSSYIETYSTTKYSDVLNTGWHHAAFVRSGNNLLLFIDGILQPGTETIVGSVNASNGVFGVGAVAGLPNEFQGLVDELRFSVGIARWTENFVVPTAPYTHWGERTKQSETWTVVS